MPTPPKKPDFSSVQTQASSKKADFSNVQSKVSSTEKPRVDFSNVQARVTSTEAMVIPGGEQTHTVAKGDTLSHIAKKYYRRPSLWRLIYEANRDQLDNPDRIRPGQVLRIPPAPKPAD
jgi:nucleoid-associated protein YgaU